MVTFKLISRNGDIYHYEFYPNKDETNPGTLIIDDKNKVVIKKVLPKVHMPDTYFYHFLQHIRDENGNMREKGFVAWA